MKETALEAFGEKDYTTIRYHDNEINKTLRKNIENEHFLGKMLALRRKEREKYNTKKLRMNSMETNKTKITLKNQERIITKHQAWRNPQELITQIPENGPTGLPEKQKWRRPPKKKDRDKQHYYSRKGAERCARFIK